MSLRDIKNAYKTRTKCKETGCSIKTNGIERAIIDVEQYQQPGTRMCDCVVVVDQGYFIIGVCELKSGKYEIHKVQEQLDEGVKFAEQVRDGHLSTPECKILPILLGKKLKGTEGALLVRSRVKIDGKKSPIIRYDCGTSMSKIIADICG